MQVKLLCTLLFYLLFTGKSSAQQRPDVIISGKVYLNYSNSNIEQKISKTYVKYLSDFKVMLIQLYFPAEAYSIGAQKTKICSNDKLLLRKYKIMVSYTDKEGKYEFRGLNRQANYLLIFCDRKIQISQVQTGNKYITYSLRDKLVVL